MAENDVENKEEAKKEAKVLKMGNALKSCEKVDGMTVKWTEEKLALARSVMSEGMSVNLLQIVMYSNNQH